MKKLKPRDGARCGMVVPEGTLFRGGVFTTVKTDLLRDLNLHMVVSLPPGTFAPYSDVKTGLLFFGATRTYERDPLLRVGRFRKVSRSSAKGARSPTSTLPKCARSGNAGMLIVVAKGRSPSRQLIPGSRTAETLAARGYDLSAKNPNAPESEKTPASGGTDSDLVGAQPRATRDS